jgi:hypothetical protein
MIPLANLIAVINISITAVVLLWIVSIEILYSKKMMIFIPFFMVSIWLCISAALNFSGISDQMVWFVFESFWGIWFLWILIILIKNKNV